MSIHRLTGRIIGNTGLKRHFFNASWLFAARILRVASNVFISIYVARYLGPERLGLLAFAMSFVGLFRCLAHLGIEGVLVKELVLKKEETDGFVGATFLLLVSGSSLIIILSMFGMMILKEDAATTVLVLIIALGYLGFPFEAFNHLFVSEIKAKYVGLSKLSGTICISMYRLILVWIGADLIWFAASIAMEKVGETAVTMYYYCKYYDTSKLYASLEHIVSLVKQCLPLMITGFGNTLFFLIGQVMIKLMLDNEQSGLYAAAYRISEAGYFIPVILTTTLYPSLVSSYAKSPQDYHAKLVSLINLLSIIAVSVVIFTLVFDTFIITFFLGPAYLESILVLKLQIIGLIPVFIGEPARRALIIENKQKYIMVFSLLAAAANMVLNYFFIPRYGIIGATWASLVSLSCAFFFFHALFKETRPIMMTQLKGFFSIKMMEVLK